jgi:hypothetical protein
MNTYTFHGSFSDSRHDRLWPFSSTLTCTTLANQKEYEFAQGNSIKCIKGFGQGFKEVKTRWKMIGCGPQSHNQCYWTWKKMPKPIKPWAHHALGLWHVLKGRMGLVNWEGKNQNPSKFVDTFWHFVTTDIFIASIQAIVGHWYCIGVVWLISL